MKLNAKKCLAVFVSKQLPQPQQAKIKGGEDEDFIGNDDVVEG